MPLAPLQKKNRGGGIKILVCFLYLKEENPVDNTGITPPLDLAKTWIKVGTLKLSYTGQSLVSVSLRECLICYI